MSRPPVIWVSKGHETSALASWGVREPLTLLVPQRFDAVNRKHLMLHCPKQFAALHILT